FTRMHILLGCVALIQTAMFRGDLAHTAVYRDTGIARLAGVKWRFHTGGRVIASPAIEGQTVYVGSTDGKLYAVDLGHGNLRWKFSSGARITSSPAIADGVVYVVSYDGNLYAVDATTGQQRWKFATEGERRFEGTHLHGIMPVAERQPDPFDVFLSSPAVYDGAVYFGSGDGHVYAVDTSGKLRWKYQAGDVIYASPAIADGIVYIGSWDSYFYALDAATGALKWRFKTGEDPDIHNQVGIQSSAAVADGVVYFGCRDSQFYALDAKTGEKKWSFDNHGSWVVSSPAVRDGVVYFGTSDSKRIWALDAKAGTPILELPTRLGMFGSPAIAGHWLYIGSWDGTLTAVDLNTKKPGWIFQTDASRTNLQTILKKNDMEPFYDAMVALVEQKFVVGPILSSPVIADHTLYVGAGDGDLYALY
ncbi:MAG TPA: PQQ-binding-like beta-propeller repeat protein, partial [Gemmatimonadaceae bacterium]|nr:PQQ-binding-like beta-propeller repeat protein [Gemmatimonadaceae bacterium]